MKASDYKILPKRNGKVDSAFRNNWKSVKFCTNYFDISIDSKKSKIYQYSFALPQDIPQDSGLYGHALASIKKTLREKIGYIAVSKQVVWGTIDLKGPMSVVCQFKEEDNEYNLEALLKPTKALDIRDLDNQQTRPIYLQILNMSLKNTLKEIKLSELGKKGEYFQKKFTKTNVLAQVGLEVLQGFRFTLTPLNSGIYLQVDVCSRVLQSRNLLQIFNGKPRDVNKGLFQGQVVISKYGTYRTYRIEQIDYKMTPMSVFYNQKKGKETTYLQYYKQAYGININNIKQPLLKAIKSVRKELVKGGKQYKEIKQIVYLVPELVSPTGMTDQQRENRDTMKILAPYTKLTPNERIQECSGVIKDINDAMGLIEVKNPKRLDGYCLPKPYIYYSGQTIIEPDNRGNIKHRGVLREPFYFSDWVFVYSGTGNGSKHDGEAEDAFQLLRKSAESYGVTFKPPGFIVIESGHVEDWEKQIQMDVKKNGSPQIVVVFLERHEQKLYADLKRFITNTIKCPSQFIRKQTLLSSKGAMSAASKIIIQMNIKVGKVPWEVEKAHPYFKDKKIMYGAVSISKGSKGNTLAFVGTLNSQCTKVFSDCRVGIKDKENIPVDFFQQIFIAWAKAYYQANKGVPELILLYREGLSIPQIRAQLPMMQIPALERMVKKIGDKTKVKDYNPQLMIVTANKKINTRYFAYSQENRMNPNKFIPSLENPDSGSVMIESLSSDDIYDFHLAAQYVTQGTCTPTLFRVAYDKSRMPQEALINFTFEQCFNYYNWEGAVRVPACLQCADKLSKLVGQYIKEDIVQSSLNKKHFFL